MTKKTAHLDSLGRWFLVNPTNSLGQGFLAGRCYKSSFESSKDAAKNARETCPAREEKVLQLLPVFLILRLMQLLISQLVRKHIWLTHINSQTKYTESFRWIKLKYIIYNNFLNPTKYISQESLYWFRQVEIVRRMLFQETNANLLTHIQALYLQNIMITSLIGFQLLRSAQLNQCGQTKRIFHLASKKNQPTFNKYIRQTSTLGFLDSCWSLSCSVNWSLHVFLLLLSLVDFCCKHPSRAGQSCKAFANFSSFSWHTYLVWNGPRPLISVKTCGTSISCHSEQMYNRVQDMGFQCCFPWYWLTVWYTVRDQQKHETWHKGISPPGPFVTRCIHLAANAQSFKASSMLESCWAFWSSMGWASKLSFWAKSVPKHVYLKITIWFKHFNTSHCYFPWDIDESQVTHSDIWYCHSNEGQQTKWKE